MESGKGSLIGRGRTADIYAWKEHQVLKLFQDWCSAGMVEHELKIARIVQAAGLPVPAVENEVAEVDGRRGIIYERETGPSMLTVLRTQPWRVVQYGRLMAKLQANIHQCTVAELPTWREYLERSIREAEALTPLMKQAALHALSQLPDGNALCHGDFHPDNIIMTPHGPVVIDWMTAVRGNPLTDVARSSVILRLGDPLPGTRGIWLINLLRGQLYSTYLGRYQQLCSITQRDVDAWQLPVAAARLNEKIPAEKNKLLRLVELSLPGIA
jgi:aminoglycoside phosphotransferase (APT) family kinase protein